LPFPDTLFQPSLASPTPSPSVSTSSSSRGQSKSPIHSSSSVPASLDGHRTPGHGADYPMYTSELSQPLFLSDSFQKALQNETDAFLTGDFNPMYALPNTSFTSDHSSSHGGGVYPPAISGETRFFRKLILGLHIQVHEPPPTQPGLALDNPSMWAGVLPEFQ
jgi:hypothetical protein